MPAEMRVAPPVNPLIACTNIARPRMPYTIEGTPDRLRMLTLMKFVSRFFGAYSSRYTAAPIPSGNAITATRTAIQKEPTSAW